MLSQPTTASAMPVAAPAAQPGEASFVPPEWTGRGVSAGHDLQIGLLRISTTDQTYRGCGWVWHVTAAHNYGNDALAQDGDYATEEEAKAAGIGWVRRHCEKTLTALKAMA
jgi:hypothetical protein